MKLGDRVMKVRSKNAGPFWVTVDIFCGSAEVFSEVSKSLKTDAIARLYGAELQHIKRFDIEDLNVIKISFPRPVVQGSAADRDMHGAQWAHLLTETDL